MAARRRLQCICNHFGEQLDLKLASSSNSHDESGLLWDYFCVSEQDVAKEVRIGNTSVAIVPCSSPELIPFCIVDPHCVEVDLHREAVLRSLRWMLQKNTLQQDMFLLGPPGAIGRYLVYRFAELLGLPVYYLCLTPDSSESDLRQRRELHQLHLTMLDSRVIECAIHGGVLLVEGLHMCERGVSSALHGLLESREMQLDDGTLLCHHTRASHLSEHDMMTHKLRPVHPSFRVVAVGPPIPRHQGSPLDPPLRSRFQYLMLDELFLSVSPSESLRSAMKGGGERADKNAVRGVVSFATSQMMISMRQWQHQHQQHLKSLHSNASPLMSSHVVTYVAKVLHLTPNTSTYRCLLRAFPFTSMALDEPIVASIRAGLDWLRITPQQQQQHDDATSVVYVASVVQEDNIIKGSDGSSLYLPPHKGAPLELIPNAPRILLYDMIVDHCVDAHICLIGPRGWGKTWLARAFVTATGMRPVVTMQLYEDVTSRDLLQRRDTAPNGDTIWINSPIVDAAISGSAIILDGLDQLKPGCFSILQRLLEDKELDLPDGTRLVAPKRWKVLQERSTPERIEKFKMRPVDPRFRMIAIGQSPTKKKRWLLPSLASLFRVHVVDPMDKEAIAHMLQGVGGSDRIVHMLLHLREAVEQLNEPSLVPLSLRQMLRICRRRMESLAEVQEVLSNCYMASFLPFAARTALEGVMNECGFPKMHSSVAASIDIIETETTLTIGNVSAPVRKGGNAALIPSVRFFPVDAHKQMLMEILKDWNAGEHILLIGNQGVGKNVLTDKLLQMLKVEREFIQLHRDTTVQSLTLAPTLIGGVLVWEDSPLVRAVSQGRCLVIDEVDKAAIEVVVVLKGLLEDGELGLSDGRRCLRDPPEPGSRDIHIHPGFRVIALANRPGFPFLGNNFFSRIGDIFATHVVGNVDQTSELQMLKSYAPNAPEFLLKSLVGLFSELRTLVDNGTLQYPYSMRELVHIAKHLNKFPQDPVASVLSNVFSVDFSNPNVAPLLRDVLLRHGIPLDYVASGQGTNGVQRASWSQIQPYTDTWKLESGHFPVSMSHPVKCTLHRPWKWRREYDLELKGRSEARISLFSELCFAFSMPYNTLVADCVASSDGNIHVLFSSPVQVVTYDPEFRRFGLIDLAIHLPYHRSFPVRPRLFSFNKGAGLVVFLPVYRIFLVVDLPGRFATPLQIPSVDGIANDATVFNDKMYPDSVSVRGDAKPVHVCQGAGDDHEQIFACWALGGNVVCFVDAIGLEQRTLRLPEAINQVLHASGPFWMVKSASSNMLWWLDSASGTAQRILQSVQRSLISSCVWSPGSFFSSAEDFMVLMERNELDVFGVGVEHFPLPENLGTVRLSVWLKQSKQLLIAAAGDHSVHLINPAQRSVRPICGVEKGVDLPADEVIAACELHDGRVLVIRRSGAASVFDTDWEKLQDAEKKWRVLAGLPETDATGNNVGGPNDGGISLSVKGGKGGDFNVKGSKGSQGSGGGGGGGSGGGAGGGSGPGSGGQDGVGIGGKSGYKREGQGGPPDPEAALQQEVDEVQRAMARKGLEEELSIIDMGKFDLQSYREIVESVAGEIEQLRSVLVALEARGKERAWLRRKTTGELDDTLLVESVVGEQAVYKRRGQQKPKFMGNQERPKRLLFVVDISASMYRFNHQDQRLARMIALCVMLMEALDTPELATKYHYRIVGHSGDDCAIDLGVEFGHPPATAKQRYQCVRRMQAHSEYCQSGDTTLQATQRAVKQVKDEEADDYFVLVVSDANLSRHGVSPVELGKSITQDPTVNAFALFIASFGDEAENLQKSLPLGKAYVTYDTSAIPAIFKQIFTSSSFMQDLD